MIELATPKISPTAFVDRSATILGDVTVGDGVYIAPNVSIRADEPGSRIIIGDGCNIQDNVVLHGLAGSELRVGKGTTLAHGCIVHGPCAIGDDCFIGFGSVVFRSIMMDGSVVLHRSLVTEVTVPPRRLIASGAIVDGRLEDHHHSEVPEHIAQFVGSVRDTNLELAEMYGRTGRGRWAGPGGAANVILQ